MHILILLFSAAVSFIFPIMGFAVFLFFNSGTTGFAENIDFINISLLGLSVPKISLMAAIFSLLIKRFNNRKGLSKLGAIEILIWVFTGLIFLSSIYNSGRVGPGLLAGIILSCLLWAPLFTAFRKMDSSQRSQCKKIIIFFSTLTALLTILIVVAKNNFLYQMLWIGRNVESWASLPIYETPVARVRIPGLWQLVPFGFWFCMNELFTKQKRSSFLIYSLAQGIMFTAIVLNITRSILAGVVFGFAMSAILNFIFVPNKETKKMFLIIFACLFSLMLVWETTISVYPLWGERLTDVLGSKSVTSRMEINKYFLDILFKEKPLFGLEKFNSFLEFYVRRISRGDPYTIVQVFCRYGLIAGFIFVFIMLFALIKLLKIIFSKKRYSSEVLRKAIFLLACYFQFHFSMAAGNYLSPITLFPLMFFLSEVGRMPEINCKSG